MILQILQLWWQRPSLSKLVFQSQGVDAVWGDICVPFQLDGVLFEVILDYVGGRCCGRGYALFLDVSWDVYWSVVVYGR
jgi:hypothetical protein